MSKSTKVYISDLGDKLFIFEHKQNGILLGEALRREPYEKPVTQAVAEPNAVELIGAYLQEKKMVVDRPRLIDIHLRGLTLDAAKAIYRQNRKRYIAYAIKLRQPETITGKALFNAFILDCERQLSNSPLV
jgi:alpha-amylase/alpha-mannosidase (GH57 family)